MSTQPLLLNQTEAAALLGVCPRTVNRLIKAGKLRRMAMKGVFIPRRELERFVREEIEGGAAA